MSETGKRLYRLFFGPRTISIEGTLLLVGLGLMLAGSWQENEQWIRVGQWLALPFLLTLAVALLVLAPWFWLKDRQRKRDV